MSSAVVSLNNEQSLVIRAAIEPEAFAAIYNHYLPLVYNYVYYRVRNTSTAEDITSQTFERALANIARYNPSATFAAWLFGIARNAVRDYYRSVHRWHWFPLDLFESQASEARGLDEVIILEETWEQTLNAISRLSNRDRDFIALKFGGRLTNRQIAELTGLSESHVGVILYRAIRRLRTELSR